MLVKLVQREVEVYGIQLCFNVLVVLDLVEDAINEMNLNMPIESSVSFRHFTRRSSRTSVAVLGICRATSIAISKGLSLRDKPNVGRRKVW